jgi:hypothetical protein
LGKGFYISDNYVPKNGGKKFIESDELLFSQGNQAFYALSWENELIPIFQEMSAKNYLGKYNELISIPIGTHASE